jgi:NaMN:DMB phosphoribosyltransferase
VQLDLLDQKPLFELDMRLGEGTGAVLATHLVSAAAAVMNDMATFDAAGVSRRHMPDTPDTPDQRGGRDRVVACERAKP